MTFKWPWVSRRALEIREQQVVDLKADLASLQIKYDDLDNQFIFRGTGVAKDPDKLPPALRRKPVIASTEVESTDNNPRILPNIRDRIKEREEALEREWEETQRRVVPISTPPKEPSEAM